MSLLLAVKTSSLSLWTLPSPALVVSNVTVPLFLIYFNHQAVDRWPLLASLACAAFCSAPASLVTLEDTNNVIVTSRTSV